MDLLKIKHILACPNCNGDILIKDAEVDCQSCLKTYPIKNNKIYFVETPERTDELDTIKGRLKKILGSHYYNIGVNIFAPTYPLNFSKKINQYFDFENNVVIDIGCGNNRLNENIIGVDLFDYDAVDIVCDLSKLPFKPDSVDGFVSRSVLEHVRHPHEIVKQLHSCTKKYGKNIHLIPFLFPFHASPFDYCRFTHKGQEVLFDKWEILEQTNPTGPVSLILLYLIEFLSIIFSFGNLKLKSNLYLIFCVFLFPFKYLDFLFVNRKYFLTLAPSILIVIRKNESLATT